ncbi:MAG: acyl-CoA dehydrogenase C-terminal domain-containing protein, partial [Alphaproteobacteria bacterium]
IAMKSGRLLRRFFDPIDRFINEHSDNIQMQEFVLPLAKAFRELQQATVWIRDQSTKNRQKLAAAANDYLRLFGLVALGSEWAKIGKIAHTALANTGEKQFYEAKIATARFYMQYLLPQSSSLVTATMSGGGSIMELDAEAF